MSYSDDDEDIPVKESESDPDLPLSEIPEIFHFDDLSKDPLPLLSLDRPSPTAKVQIYLDHYEKPISVFHILILVQPVQP